MGTQSCPVRNFTDRSKIVTLLKEKQCSKANFFLFSHHELKFSPCWSQCNDYKTGSFLSVQSFRFNWTCARSSRRCCPIKPGYFISTGRESWLLHPPNTTQSLLWRSRETGSREMQTHSSVCLQRCPGQHCLCDCVSWLVRSKTGLVELWPAGCTKEVTG